MSLLDFSKFKDLLAKEKQPGQVKTHEITDCSGPGSRPPASSQKCTCGRRPGLAKRSLLWSTPGPCGRHTYGLSGSKTKLHLKENKETGPMLNRKVVRVSTALPHEKAPSQE